MHDYINVLDGPLYQWDVGREVEIKLPDGETATVADFSRDNEGSARVVEIKNGKAEIPNDILQQHGTLRVWAVSVSDGRITRHSASFAITRRAKPDNYIYTPTEILDWRELERDINELAKRVDEIGQEGSSLTVDDTLTIPGAAADAAVVGGKIEELSEEIGDLSASGPDALTEEQKASWRESIGAFGVEAKASPNLYDPSLQTPETIAPHYYVKGVPYETTQYDNMWNCTAPIAVKPNTTYTVGLVPAYHYVYGSTDVMIEKPWSHAGNGVFCYDADGNFIKGYGEANTFTTPENCASIRFNYMIGQNVTLTMLSARCMLVEGTALPTVYEPYGTSNSATGIANVLSANGLSHYEYKNDVLTVIQNGTKTVYGYHGNNGIMMCKGYGLENAYVPFTTDILSPMIITASENADGDLEDTYRLTGGNHSYLQTSGTPTANTVLVEVFADGKPAEESGLFNTLVLHARHEVQAWNTTKEDGTGRAVLIEDDYITWDGKRMNVEIHLTPTEAVVISVYYGLQLAEINSCNVYGSMVKKNIASGGYSDEVPYYIEGICDGFRIRMHLDETGLGEYTYNTSAVKYSTNDYKKAYFRPIGEGHSFTADDCLWLRGYFEILPLVGSGS